MSKTALWVGVVVVVVAGLFLWMSSASAPAVDEGAASSATVQDANTQGIDSAGNTSSTGAAPGANVAANVNASVGGASMSATVTYDGTSFAPSSVTIGKGGTVTFTQNASSGTDMWVASVPHPIHTGYDSTSRTEHCATGYSGAKPLDQCAKARSFSFTFDKAGTFPYHDHMNTSAFGKVVVVE